MKDDPLPRGDHVLRYAAPRHVDRGNGHGAPIVLGTAFWSRPSEDNRASYNWLECLAESLAEQVGGVRERRRLQYKPNGQLCRLNVGYVVSELVAAFPEVQADLVHDPLEASGEFGADDSHSVMLNMPCEGQALVEAMGDVIAQCIVDVFPPTG